MNVSGSLVTFVYMFVSTRNAGCEMYVNVNPRVVACVRIQVLACEMFVESI